MCVMFVLPSVEGAVIFDENFSFIFCLKYELSDAINIL